MCPFAALCLPDFLKDKARPSKSERVHMALDALARSSLMNDSLFPEKDNDRN